VFERTVALLGERVPHLVPVIPAAAAVGETVRRATAAWPRRPIVVTELDDKHDAYAAARAALTKSGTSTLELALAGVPMAVTYRVNPVSAAVARRLIRVPHVAMVNLLAERAVVPELLQEACTPARLAETLSALLTDHALAAAQRAAFRQVLARLAAPCGTPSQAAAAEVLEMIGARNRSASDPIARP
jgi:lipid-A-disaccharide synthase